MHLCDIQNGVLGTNAIVAAHIPIAGGVALANLLRKNQQVTLCFFGDGASCEGEFFESLNMAALWKLPAVFICENNGYAISVPTKLSQSTPDISDRAEGFGIPVQIVDGNDVLAVHAAAKEAVDHARSGKGPFMIECKTVRWERHSAFSAGKYANPEEAQRWKKVDPIPRLGRHLLDMGVTSEDLQAQEASARKAILEAVEFAVQSPLPSSETLYDGVFA
jgi:pyruvate dehydrogenase E1 component alpha subunit